MLTQCHQMIYPAYKLNPGDMFQVEPERVMYATGAPKPKSEDTSVQRVDALDEESVSEKTEEPASTEAAAPVEAAAVVDPQDMLKSLLFHAKSILSEKANSSAKRKQELRSFQRAIRKTMSRPAHAATLLPDLDAQLTEIMSKLNISTPDSASATPAGLSSTPDPSSLSKQSTPGVSLTITNAEKRQLQLALEEARENPLDSTKTYATPWRPRDYMSAFAFVPRYLEVHHKICSAVYLRHPVVRPGLGEVPTPFGEELMGLAFNWYLRRR